MFLNNSQLEKQNNNKTISLISSYYSNQIPSYSNIIKNSVTSLQLTELPKELISVKENDDDLCTKIENSLKKKYNFVIPAIQIEFAADSKIELIKEDLNKFFSLFGEISYINIVEDKSNAYILYKFYFSAMFAYYAIRDILNINNDGQNFINSGNDEKIDVKLFMNKNGNEKEEDEKNINDYENNNNNANNFGNVYNMVTPVKSSLDFQFKGSNNFKEKISVLNNFHNNNNNNNSNNDNVNTNKINYYQIINNNNNNSVNSFNINQKINPFSNNSNVNYSQQEKNEEDYYESDNRNFMSNNTSNIINNNDSHFKNSNKKKFTNNNNNFTNFNNNLDIDPDFYFAQQRQILMNYMMMNYIQNYRYKMINIMKNKDVYLNSKNNPYKEPKINFESFTLDHKNTINFNTFSNREYIFKYVTNYNIQIENDDKFQVTKRIIGKNGFFLKKIIYESCIKYGDNSTKIRLRGKGSGYKEGKVFSESDEPLQLCVSSLNFPTYINCCNLIENLLKRIYKDYAEYLKKITSPELRGNIMEKSISKYIYVVDRFGPKKENYDEEGEIIDKSEDYNNNVNENCYVDDNNNKINILNNNNNIVGSNNIKKCCCNCCCNNKINNINNNCNNNECNDKIEEKKEK